MISTGTDIKPLECLLFMRSVRSSVYFEQMKGRGTRTISPTDLQGVTPDAKRKERFVIVDAVGVCENDKTDSRPLERKRGVPFDKLLISLAMGNRDEDTLTSLAGRLARLDREISEKERQEISAVTGGPGLRELINSLLDAVDEDRQIERAGRLSNTETPSEERVRQGAEELAKEAAAPFDNPRLRNTLIDLQQQNEQVIDTVTLDRVTLAGYDGASKEKAQRTVESFQRFIQENKDELTALQILYEKPYARRHLAYGEIKQLAEAIRKPPYSLTPEGLWQAYEQLEKSKVRGAGPQRLLTDMIALVRFAMGASEKLEPFSITVEAHFAEWLAQQEGEGRRFTPEQREWLGLIKEQIVSSGSLGWDDFDATPFFEKGGRVRAAKVFGPELDGMMGELNRVLVG